MKKYIIISCLLVIYIKSIGQDIHFSQFYNAPLSLNPAMTGYFGGNLRGVINHRSQWNSIADPFVTSSISVDTRLFDNLLKEDAVGAGIILVNDKSGPADLSYFKMAFSGSYFKMLGKEGEHLLALGAQAGFFQRWIDIEKLQFESQFSDLNFNSNANSGENLNNFNIVKSDFQAGVLYQYKEKEKYRINSGLSFFHLTQPNESLLNNIDQLSLRSAFFSNAQIKTGKITTINPGLLVMFQNRAKEINIGGTLNYLLKSYNTDDITISLGGWVRPSDAFILLIGGAFKKWEMNLSYDINLSSLSKASNYKGGFELSIIYIDRWLTKERKIPVVKPCPRI